MAEPVNVCPAECFEKRYNNSWPLQGEPSSDHAVPTAAKHSVMEITWLT
jgi:hypothetical protein